MCTDALSITTNAGRRLRRDYVNTLMIQNVLADEAWMDRMAEEDRRALTPLIHGHVNPYGNFELDMKKRLLLDLPVALAV